jgi:hypothetical protein
MPIPYLRLDDQNPDISTFETSALGKLFNMRAAWFEIALALLLALVHADEFPNPCKRGDYSSDPAFTLRLQHKTATARSAQNSLPLL